MKKVLFLMVLISAMFTIESKAQNVTLIALAAGDTVVNAGTASKVINATAGYQGIVIQAKATEISGTSAGTIKIQGSLDGSNYSDIGSAYTVTDVASQSTMFYVTGPLPRYIKVLQTGSGTMSSVLTVRYVFRLHN